MPDTATRVDDAGVHLPAGFSGSCDVLFDDHHAWSFTAKGRRKRSAEGETLVAWPPRMERWLNGASYVRVVEKETEHFAGEVVFGDGDGRVEFVDRDGIPVMIDKWGLLQRPFSGRDSRVIVQMVEMADEILEVMRRECGLHGWIAFGTLLGAMREGKVIGHDSDIDLAYVSTRPTPAEMTVELYDVARALRRHGMSVQNKSGSFITVVFPVPDGSKASIDVYTCFYVGEHLYETATVREVVPRSAIEPLTELEFEGKMLPAPADPARMLEVSYGPGWRVPDPSFRHEPGPEITRRFDGWFGSLMRNRRDWERYLTDLAKDPEHGPSAFAGWVADLLEPGTTVIEIGSGTGQDAVLLGTPRLRGPGLRLRPHQPAAGAARGAAARSAGEVPAAEPLRPARRADPGCARLPQGVDGAGGLRAGAARVPGPGRAGELLAPDRRAPAHRRPGLPRGRGGLAPGPRRVAFRARRWRAARRSTRGSSRASRPGPAAGSCTARASSRPGRHWAAAHRRGGG